MCGHHVDPGPDLISLARRPIGRARRRLHRRAFLGEVGGVTALALLGPAGLASCGSDEDAQTAESTTSTTAGAEPSLSTSSTAGSTPETGVEEPAGSWGRVDLGFVSAYVLARGNRAAVVDTGVEGSAEAIGRTLGDLGLTFDDVDAVALTHYHPDHVGSIGAVLAAAPGAIAYAGEQDIERITGVELMPVGDGSEVFGMRVIHTPGHTLGHIALLDELTGVLVAGDAMNGVDGGVAGANPDFTPDMSTADASVRKLAALAFDTVYFGHGEPIVGGASQAVGELAAQL